MNSEYIIKLLHELLNTQLTERQRSIITQSIQHIRRQGDELEDITETRHPRDPSDDPRTD